VIDYTAETGDAEDKVLELARKRRSTCLQAESTTRAQAEQDLKFAAGDQWPESIRFQREMDSSGARPCLTVNKTGQYVRQVVNDGRQNSPGIKVFPTGGEATQETAEILMGLIRDIEQRTDADIAYDTALESTARTGEGYWRLITRYLEEETGFDQELAYERIRNMFAVHLDPNGIDPAGADCKFGFVDEWLSTAEFEEQYGDERMAGLDSQGLGEYAPDWIREGQILVADYYSVEEGQKRTLAMMKDGTQIIVEEQKGDVDPEEIVIARPIKTTRCVIRKISGNSVLEKTVFPCRYIPVFRVIGEEFEVDGKIILQGLIRPQKDSQRMYNYWISSATEKGALESKAPYVGAEGQFEGHENQWKNANRVPFAYLEYKPVSLEGSLAPPPQRNVATFAGAADIQMSQLASEDMKSVVGIYDAGLGAASNEKSGRAIIARQREADTGTYHYVDNLGRAIRHCGRVLVDVLPKYLSNAQVVRIVGIDDEDEMVPINQREKAEDGSINKINDITVGRYDVIVESGPSYATKRLEAADSMMAFVQAVPAAGQAVMDLIAKAMDWPGADKIADRLRKMVPQQLLDDDENGLITPDQVDGMIQEAVMAMQAKFEASIQNRETEVKEYEAQTDRMSAEAKAQTDQIDAIAKMVPDEGQLREMVGEMLAEFLTDVQSSVQSTT